MALEQMLQITPYSEDVRRHIDLLTKEMGKTTALNYSHLANTSEKQLYIIGITRHESKSVVTMRSRAGRT